MPHEYHVREVNTENEVVHLERIKRKSDPDTGDFAGETLYLTGSDALSFGVKAGDIVVVTITRQG